MKSEITRYRTIVYTPDMRYLKKFQYLQQKRFLWHKYTQWLDVPCYLDSFQMNEYSLKHFVNKYPNIEDWKLQLKQQRSFSFDIIFKPIKCTFQKFNYLFISH